MSTSFNRSTTRSLFSSWHYTLFSTLGRLTWGTLASGSCWNIEAWCSICSSSLTCHSCPNESESLWISVLKKSKKRERKLNNMILVRCGAHTHSNEKKERKERKERKEKKERKRKERKERNRKERKERKGIKNQLTGQTIKMTEKSKKLKT